MVFIGLRQLTAWSIPGHLLRGGWPIATKGTAKTLWLQADKHLTPADRQVLEHNPVIKAVKGIDTPLTCVACGMLSIFSINRGKTHVVAQDAPRSSSLARSSMISFSGGI